MSALFQKKKKIKNYSVKCNEFKDDLQFTGKLWAQLKVIYIYLAVMQIQS